MNQQINLFQPIFRAQRKIFSAIVIAQIIGIATVALLLIYGYSYWQTRQLFTEYSRLQQQQNELTAKLTQFQTTLPKQVRSEALGRELKKLEDERNLKAEAVNALKDRSLGSTAGFSQQLAALGSHRTRGLWLTDILFAGGGADFELAGRAMDARLVPQYLQVLAAGPTFDGIAFKSMRIGQAPAHSPAKISFLLSTASDIKDALAQEAKDAKADRSH